MYTGANPTALKSRQWIMKALIHLMMQKDYASISVKEICKQADLSRQTFYNLFSSKDDILHEYLREQVAKALQEIKEKESSEMLIQESQSSQAPESQNRLSPENIEPYSSENSGSNPASNLALENPGPNPTKSLALENSGSNPTKSLTLENSESKTVKNLTLNLKLQDMVQAFISVLESNQQLLRCMISQGLENIIIEEVSNGVSLFAHSFSAEKDERILGYSTAFLSGGLAQCLLWWFKQSKPLKLSELITLLNQALSGNLYKL